MLLASAGLPSASALNGEFKMSVLSVPEPDFMADPDIRMFAEQAARFFKREAPPERVEQWRQAGQVDCDIWTTAGAAGLLGVSIPEAYGGAGGDFRHDVVLVEQLARNAVEGFALQLHN